MKFSRSVTIGKIVTENIETASVFNDHGINFYSKGYMTLEEACQDKNISIESLIEDLTQIDGMNKDSHDFAQMSTKKLCNYIIPRHHDSIRKKIVFVRHTLAKFNREQECEQAILHLTKNTFEKLSAHIANYLQCEQEILFPLIINIDVQNDMSASGFKAMIQHLASIGNVIENEIKDLIVIPRISRKRWVENENRDIYTSIHNVLMELQNDVKIQMHLENNILFPKILESILKNELNIERRPIESAKASLHIIYQ